MSVVQLESLEICQPHKQYCKHEMAAKDTTVAVPRDDLDDLFDYGVNDADDPFREFNANLNAPIQEDPSRTSKVTKRGADLGIDTEIKVTKKRAPTAKLNEDRYAGLYINGVTY